MQTRNSPNLTTNDDSYKRQDYENRIVEILDDAGNTAAEVVHDALGRRIGKRRRECREVAAKNGKIFAEQTTFAQKLLKRRNGLSKIQRIILRVSKV